ncbi:hypothetical protein CLV84_3080 [Neolewinella xylanilytica]|uniref:Quinol:cytochrome c oxidoreductase quinone-binding subunit 2 n=1 Tax=Neolewinella xylanilytica TaxID=1514080 RepID=A0A2S6I4Z4_9BACT|nr:hypothetical protein [Neolewinella xylanilytica]PPK86161.1 hypothetical protein CLV84_3080 [Neolewinella xylanilytica]
METFVFSSRAKITTLSMMGVGLLCLLITFFADGGEGHHMRFWTNFLHNSVFFVGIAAIAGFALAAFTTAYAGWFVQFKRVWESFGTFLLPGLFLLGVIMVGLFTHGHHLYHWNDDAAVASDAILEHKSSFLNKYWYTFGTIGFVGFWYFMIGKMRNISIAEDLDDRDNEFTYYKRYKKYAAIFLPIFGFTSAAMIWQWIMSIDSHWYSTMFAWYASASLFVAMTALTIMLLIYLKSRGYFPGVNEEHFHDLGKYLFAISIFWTYVWFSQFMLIWYANVGEETIYFRERMQNYPVLFWTNLGLNFLLPFFVLMRNDTKRKMGTLFFASALVFFGHWLDFFSMIKPGARLSLIEMTEHAGGHAEGEEHAEMGAAHAEEDEFGHDQHAEGHDADETAALAQGEVVSEGDNLQDPAGRNEDAIDNENIHFDASEEEEGVPVANEFRGGPPDTRMGGIDELASATDRTDADVFEPNHFIQEENIGDDEMLGHLEAAGGHSEALSVLGFKSGYTLPGLLEIGTFIGFLGGFLFFVLSKLSTARMEPKHDPYLEESLHHHT